MLRAQSSSQDMGRRTAPAPLSCKPGPRFEAQMRMAAESALSAVEAFAAGPDPQFADVGANSEGFQRSVLQMLWRFEAALAGALIPRWGRGRRSAPVGKK